MSRPVQRHTPTHADGRPMKITFGEMRETGVRDLLVFCTDYRCGHDVTLVRAVVDRWPDHIRLS
jgi:hypothetical protein